MAGTPPEAGETMKKATWEKLLDRMEKATELAAAVCEEMDFDCERCPLYMEVKDRDCAKYSVRYVRNILKAYERKQNVKTFRVHGRGPEE